MTEKKCPKCGIVGDIAEVFGYRKVPHPIPQSWCRLCRNGKLPPQSAPAEYQFDAPKLSEIAVNATSGMSFSPGKLIINRWQLTSIYSHWYPNDKADQKRSVKFMTEKLHKRGVNHFEVAHA